MARIARQCLCLVETDGECHGEVRGASALTNGHQEARIRGFLIFLAIAFPIVLLSPGFWMLVEMEVGALPMTLIHQDGRRQDSMTGPKSP